jgi:hypothetical protein
VKRVFQGCQLATEFLAHHLSATPSLTLPPPNRALLVITAIHLKFSGVPKKESEAVSGLKKIFFMNSFLIEKQKRIIKHECTSRVW